MTQTKKIIILDCSTSRIIVTTCEYDPEKDMEEAVFERYNEMNLRDSECSWMEIQESIDDIEIETDQPINLVPLNYN